MQRGKDMNETRFLISEAARTAEVETHVLRYWEEELDLPIARNEMGHRCYTRQDIQIFLSIKELKKKGFQLKTIKELIPLMRRELYSRSGLFQSDLSSQEGGRERVGKRGVSRRRMGRQIEGNRKNFSVFWRV